MLHPSVADVEDVERTVGREGNRPIWVPVPAGEVELAVTRSQFAPRFDECPVGIEDRDAIVGALDYPQPTVGANVSPQGSKSGVPEVLAHSSLVVSGSVLSLGVGCVDDAGVADTVGTACAVSFVPSPPTA